MGDTFRLIADRALPVIDDASGCDVCETVATLYPYDGEMTLNGGAFLISEACRQCILSGELRLSAEQELERLLRSLTDSVNAQQMLDQLRRTPTAPLQLQFADWVVCCDALCEFAGSPSTLSELLQAVAARQYWERGTGKTGRNFVADGGPESLGEISWFDCARCGRTYWSDQFT